MLFSVSAQYAKAQTPDVERTAEDLRAAADAGDRHRAELMKIPHVIAVTGEVNGRSEAAILIEVDNQKNLDEVLRKAPSKVEGFPVEVEEGHGEDESRDPALEAGHWGGAAPTPVPPPTIDKNGYYHHTWLKSAMPVATPGASQ